MKKIFLLIVLPLVIVLFSGCKEDSFRLDDYTESKHYVNSYVLPNTMVVEPAKTVKGTPEGLKVRFDGVVLSHFADTYDPGFLQIAKVNGDTAYNKEIRHFRQEALGTPIRSINVVALDNMDAAHPAGSSLNDVLTVKSVPLNDYFKHHYDRKFLRTNQEQILKLSANHVLEKMWDDSFLHFYYTANPALVLPPVEVTIELQNGTTLKTRSNQ